MCCAAKTCCRRRLDRSRCMTPSPRSASAAEYPRVRPPPLCDGPGQQEALEARPRVQPARLSREAASSPRAAELFCPAGLGNRRRPRHLQHGQRWSPRSRSTASTPTRRASTSRSVRPSTRRTFARCRSTSSRARGPLFARRWAARRRGAAEPAAPCCWTAAPLIQERMDDPRRGCRHGRLPVR